MGDMTNRRHTVAKACPSDSNDMPIDVSSFDQSVISPSIQNQRASKMAKALQDGDYVRLRGVRGFEGRFGRVHRVLGHKLITIDLFSASSPRNVLTLQKRLKAKPRQLEKATHEDFLVDAKVKFWTCRPRRSTPTLYGGANARSVADVARSSKELNWLPRTATLPTLDIDPDYPDETRRIYSRLDQGDFSFCAYADVDGCFEIHAYLENTDSNNASGRDWVLQRRREDDAVNSFMQVQWRNANIFPGSLRDQLIMRYGCPLLIPLVAFQQRCLRLHFQYKASVFSIT
jgi:hypothetical protein